MGRYNIGPKIGIEGEKEFRNQIKNINDSYKALEAETRAVTAAFDANGDEQGKLRAQSKQLEKEIDLQKQKMDLLQDALVKASAKYDENSIEVTRLRGALYDAKATMAGLENELQNTKDQLSKTGDAMGDVADHADAAGDSVVDFGDILKANLASDLIMNGLEKAGDVVKEFTSGTIEAAADVKAANSQFSQSFGDLEDKARSALENISSDTNIASTRMQGSYTRIFAFAKTTGAESDAALDIASRAMIAAADSAAYYDRSIEDVAETIQAFLKGNYANDAALGISATEVSRNTMANQLYAKSFQELSEAQKVDTLLAMVEAGNAASGAIGQAARESDSWENVTGELAEAYRQLQAQVGKPVLQKLTPVIQKITKAAYELIDDVDWEEFGDTVEDVADVFIDNGPAILKTITSLAAGFVAFKATQKAQQLVSVASSFIQTAAAAKTAGTAVAASGAVAMASPWGLVATAIAGVVALVTSLAIEAETSVSDLERSSERLQNAFENAEETYRETTAEINGSATAAEYYIQRLYELEAAGLDSAVAHREYELTVEALNELIPDLNLAIDEQTGLINANKDALLADVEAWKQNATAKALQEKYADVIEAQARAEADLLDAQARRNQLADKEQDLRDALTKKNEEYNKVSKELTSVQKRCADAANLTADEIGPLQQKIQSLTAEQEKLGNEYMALKYDIEDNLSAQDKLQKEIDEASKVVRSYDEKIQNAENAMELFNKQTSNTSDGQSDLVKKVQAVQAEIDQITAAYEEAKDAAYESLTSQIGLFDELSVESDWTASKILDNWQSQQKAFADYQKNLKKAKSLGLDDAIVDQLSDGSTESMQILDALVNDAHIRVADINKAFEGLDQSKKNVSSTLADVKTDFSDMMEDIAADARQYGIIIGSNFSVGLNESLIPKSQEQVSSFADSLFMGGVKSFDFGTNTVKNSSSYLPGLDGQLARAQIYPGLYSGSVTTQSSASTKTVNMGGITVQINAQDGQDVYEIAQAVQEVLQTEIAREEAGL